MLLLKLIANLPKNILRIKVRKSNSVKCYINIGLLITKFEMQ